MRWNTARDRSRKRARTQWARMPLILKRNLKLLGGFIGNGEPPPPPPCVRACILLVSMLRNIHKVINGPAETALENAQETHHLFLVLSRMENPPVRTVFLCGQLKMTKNFMYTLPFLLQLGRVASEEATVDFRRKTLQEKKSSKVNTSECILIFVSAFKTGVLYYVLSLSPLHPPPPLSLSLSPSTPLQCSKIKRNWWSPKLKAGVRGPPPEKNLKFKVAKPPEI